MLAKHFIEMQEQECIYAEPFDGAKFLPNGIDQLWDVLWGDDCIGMAVEGDHEADGLVLTRIGNRLTNDLLVAQMNSIEKTDGQADFAAGGLEFGGSVDGAHPKGLNGLNRELS